MEAEEQINKMAKACLEMIRLDLAEHDAILNTMPLVDREAARMALRDVLYRELGR